MRHCLLVIEFTVYLTYRYWNVGSEKVEMLIWARGNFAQKIASCARKRAAPSLQLRARLLMFIYFWNILGLRTYTVGALGHILAGIIVDFHSLYHRPATFHARIIVYICGVRWPSYPGLKTRFGNARLVARSGVGSHRSKIATENSHNLSVDKCPLHLYHDVWNEWIRNSWW